MPKEKIKYLKFLLASPSDILNWSYGEVLTPETIHYRTQRAEMGGLMCERIFGPTRDYECYCGKYRGLRFKGIICDKCGVEVTSSKVRRQRMGHIRLAAPIVHLWYAYGTPNKLAILLDIPYKKLMGIIYYTLYVVTKVDEDKRPEVLSRIKELEKQELEKIKEEFKEEKVRLEAQVEELKEKIKKVKKPSEGIELQNQLIKLKAKLANLNSEQHEKIEEAKNYYQRLYKTAETLQYKTVLTEELYRDFLDNDLMFFEAMMGAEAIRKLLQDIDVEKEIINLRERFNKASSLERQLIERKLKYLEGVYKNGLKLEWMVMDVLPVLPAGLRPIIMLPGGRFATSDLNDLYRRVMIRNNRLKKLMEIGAPEIILRNEKRMLQEAVDALFDNQHRPMRPVTTRGGIPLKSLAETLRGKKGRFRRNLLGKRVDYSGRAVIIPSTVLGLNEVGLPKDLALEIFKPFVIRKLIEQGKVTSISEARELVEIRHSSVYEALEEVIKDRVVLLNRAPSLHKYSIQAFYPKLVEGSAIRINQIITDGFNADFDGDTMAVFAVLTDEALKEAKERMLPVHNLIKAASGEPVVTFGGDLVVGIYHLTYMEEVNEKETKQIPRFGDPDEVVGAYDLGVVGLQDPVYIVVNGKSIITSPGRVIFNQILPEDFEYINETINKKRLNQILREVMLNYPKEIVQRVLERMRTVAFHFATQSGFTLNAQDFVKIKEVEKKVQELKEKTALIHQQYEQGFLTKEQRDSAVTDLWSDAMNELADMVWNAVDDKNPLKNQVISGAKGSKLQLMQILGVIGIVNDISGMPVPYPILGSYAHGINPMEYVIAAKGGRKGMLDTALNTRKAGYLTRKLVEVTQAVITRYEDCGYDGDGIAIRRDQARELSFGNRLIGRTVTKDVIDPRTKKVLVKKGEMIDVKTAKKIENIPQIKEVWVRSPITCQGYAGICVKCYGYDLGKYKPVQLGSAVGVLAAQSVSEPATQLTLRTFHGGGVGRDITSGLPLLTEYLEMRSPKNPAVLSPVKGVVSIRDGKVFVSGVKTVKTYYIIDDIYELKVQDQEEVKKGQVLMVSKVTNQEIKAPFAGKVRIEGKVLFIEGSVEVVLPVKVPEGQELIVKDGQEVEPGDALTSGRVDIKQLAQYKPHQYVQEFLLDRLQEIFADFHIEVQDIHFEVIIRQLASLAKIIHPGDTGYITGSLRDRHLLRVRNQLLEKEGKTKVVYQPVMMGLTALALNVDSVLAAASFQEQPRVLTEAALLGKTDYLRGLKENVIIGHIIPLNEHAIIPDVTKLDEMYE